MFDEETVAPVEEQVVEPTADEPTEEVAEGAEAPAEEPVAA